MKKALLFTLLFVPAMAAAQSTIQTFLGGVNTLINGFIIPFLLSLAVLFFIYNTVKYFIIQSADEDGRTKAKQFMLYSIAGFVLIMALWGIVSFIIEGIGISSTKDPVCPDYPPGACTSNPPPSPPSPPSPPATISI